MNNLPVKHLLEKLKINGKSATYIIIYACVLVWIVQIILNTFSHNAYEIFIENTALSPYLITKTSWTWFTSMFVHSLSIGHIFFNMLCLYSLGLELEHFFGKWKFFFLYTLSGLGGSVATVLYCTITKNFAIASVGASGAIMGLIGALLVAQWKLRQDVRGTLIWIAITLALPIIVPNIAWQAHVGGLVVGFVLAALLSLNNHIFKNLSLNKRFAIYAILLLIILVAIAVSCFYFAYGLDLFSDLTVNQI